jgi:hypothetical protein
VAAVSSKIENQRHPFEGFGVKANNRNPAATIILRPSGRPPRTSLLAASNERWQGAQIFLRSDDRSVARSFLDYLKVRRAETGVRVS